MDAWYKIWAVLGLLAGVAGAFVPFAVIGYITVAAAILFGIAMVVIVATDGDPLLPFMAGLTFLVLLVGACGGSLFHHLHFAWVS